MSREARLKELELERKLVKVLIVRIDAVIDQLKMEIRDIKKKMQKRCD